MSDLDALITRLAANADALLKRGEMATRLAAIDPVLQALGWDTVNLDEVDPEISDRSGGRVDYGLRHGGRDLVLVEAKAASVNIEKHQEQLLNYAFSVGVEMAALTNGLMWQLYLPMAPGRSWDQRRFANIDFRTDAAAGAIALQRFLNRDDTVSGAALAEAQGELERQERALKVRAELEAGWQDVLSDHRTATRDLVARTIAELPDADVANFLRGLVQRTGLLGATVRDPAPPDIAPARPAASPPTGASGDAEAAVTPGTKAAATRASRWQEVLSPETHDWEYVRSGYSADGVHSITGRPLKTYHVLRDRRSGDEVTVGGGEMATYAGIEPPAVDGGPSDFSGKRPSAFRLDGGRHEVSHWRGVLAGVCDLVVGQVGLERFAQAVEPVRGKTRVYFSPDRSALFMPTPIANAQFFVEGNFSANDCVRRARQVLTAVRGSDDGFSVEIAD